MKNLSLPKRRGTATQWDWGPFTAYASSSSWCGGGHNSKVTLIYRHVRRALVTPAGGTPYYLTPTTYHKVVLPIWPGGRRIWRFYGKRWARPLFRVLVTVDNFLVRHIAN